MDEILEDSIITKIAIEECVKKFDPEIQEILYSYYGDNLENVSDESLRQSCQTIDMLERLSKLGNASHQKLILMRFGMVTGTPATVQEAANEFQISRERVRAIESKFLRSGKCSLTRRKKLTDYLDD